MARTRWQDQSEVECQECKTVKPRHEFYDHQRICKPCRAELQRQYIAINRERKRAWTRASHQRHGHKYAAKRKADPSWMEKQRQKARVWYWKNRERAQAKSAAWFKANPRKAVRYVQIRKALKRAGGEYSEADAVRMFNRFLGKCAYCGEAKATDIDHVLPLCRGGRNTIGNLLPACGSCNCSKHRSTIVQWRRRGGWLNVHHPRNKTP